MQELLDFVKQKVESKTFIGLSSQYFNEEQSIYVVDYWQPETQTNELGEIVDIMAGKQRMFTL